MSYPGELQVLIIEDETSMVTAYRRWLNRIGDGGIPVAPPRVASGYAEALSELNSSRIFHAVILDLKLPETAGGDAEGGGPRGLGLVQLIANREAYPIPVLMVITANPDNIEKFPPLIEQLRSGFAYGVVMKKLMDMEGDIREGLEAAAQYASFGIHLVDDTQEPRPPLTPREDDLIRRCCLSKVAVGVDLRWWSAERCDWGDGAEKPQWSKVLHGRFLLPGTDGTSRPRFFKLGSRENGEQANASACRLGQKLQHMRVEGYLSGKQRSLLVTDKAGPSGADPIQLAQLLTDGTPAVARDVERIARDIADQLRHDDHTNTEEHTLVSLLWGHHRKPALRAIWNRYTANDIDEDVVDDRLHYLLTEMNAEPPRRVPPDILLSLVEEHHQTFWLKNRPCQHGDLHLGNVALDVDFDTVRAYIIDPGALKQDVCGRDLAALEVSLLLHQRYVGDTSLVSECADLFDGYNVDGQSAGSVVSASAHHRNTRLQIIALRREALKEVDAAAYAILLLDQALIQMGTFAYGTSQNKIFRAPDAVELYEQLALWVGQVFFLRL